VNMVSHNVMFSLTVSPETIAAMSYDEFMEFWTAYGKIIRLLSKVRVKLNEEGEEF
ncbi:hypothetical protein LCGC14_2681310, partial [marine sediment metagenome]